jgi:hypothetical protein
VKRKGGVHQVEGFLKPDSEIEQFRLKEIDGWDTPISVRLTGLPPGVFAEKIEAPPRNTVFKGNDGEELFVDGTVVEIPIQIAADASAGHYKIEVWAEGTFKGKAVRRQGRVVFASQAFPLRGDNHLHLTVVDPPPLLLQTPDTLTLSQGQVLPVKVSVYRFSGTAAPVDLSVKDLPLGIVATTTSLAGGQNEAEVLLTASAEAPQTATSIIFTGTLRTGEGEELVWESPSVELLVQPPRQ